MNKITSAQKLVMEDATLPDGTYSGIWGGHVIKISTSKGDYHLTTEQGVRGVGYKVSVRVIDGEATFSHKLNI